PDAGERRRADRRRPEDPHDATARCVPGPERARQAVRRGPTQRSAHRRHRPVRASSQQRGGRGSAGLTPREGPRRLRMTLAWLSAAALAAYLAIVALLAAG